MTRMSMSVQRLAEVERELLSHRDAITSVVSQVEAPAEGYPYHRLIDDAVAEMLQDARLAATRCRRFAEAVGDHLHDLSQVDGEVAASAARGKVR